MEGLTKGKGLKSTETKAEARARKKKEREARRRAKAARKAAKNGVPVAAETKEEGAAAGDINSVARGDAGKLTAEQIRVATMRAVTGVLASQPQERDLKFDSFSVQVGGNHLITDCRLELNQGCRYGLIGQLAVCA